MHCSSLTNESCFSYFSSNILGDMYNTIHALNVHATYILYFRERFAGMGEWQHNAARRLSLCAPFRNERVVREQNINTHSTHTPLWCIWLEMISENIYLSSFPHGSPVQVFEAAAQWLSMWTNYIVPAWMLLSLSSSLILLHFKTWQWIFNNKKKRWIK